MQPNRPALFVCRHGEREDYAWKRRGENWQAQAERPWDTPLTPAGHLQALACGKSLATHCAVHGLKPVSSIVSSPLLRCIETAAAIAKALGIKRVSIEPRLAETMCEEWYRSWATPGADSSWGGPEMGTAMDRSQLHPASVGPASACHSTATTIECLRRAHSLSDLGRQVEVVDTTPPPPPFAYTWGEFETEAAQAGRMREVAESQLPASTSAGSVLLVSHGGPTGSLYHELSSVAPPLVGFCGLFAYARPENGEGWEVIFSVNHDHLKLVEGATHSRPNDMIEQHA